MSESSDDVTRQSNFKFILLLTLVGAVSFGIWKESATAGIFALALLSILSLIALSIVELT